MALMRKCAKRNIQPNGLIARGVEYDNLLFVI